MHVKEILDPRGPLELASRDELYAYARANGVTEIDEAMYLGGYAADKMRKILTAKGFTRLSTVLRPFNEVQGQQSEKALTVEDLAEQKSNPLPPRVTPTVDANVMSRAELAKECKRRGIKMERTDTKEKLQERLSVSHAS